MSFYIIITYSIVNCPVSLNQGRYTWRHDAVLSCLYRIISMNMETSGLIIYADLPNLRASESPPSTIPVSLVTTTARPDMVIIDGNVVTLLEMTIPIKHHYWQENLNRTIFLCLVIFKRAGILLS